METLTLICSMVSLIIAVISGIIGIVAFIELRSFMKSTHKVEFVPIATDNKQKAPTVDDELEKFGL